MCFCRYARYLYCLVTVYYMCSSDLCVMCITLHFRLSYVNSDFSSTSVKLVLLGFAILVPINDSYWKNLDCLTLCTIYVWLCVLLKFKHFYKSILHFLMKGANESKTLIFSLFILSTHIAHLKHAYNLEESRK